MLSAAERFSFFYEGQILGVDGQPLSKVEGLNLVPLQGATYYQNAALKGGPQHSRWYMGFFGGDYDPKQELTAQDVASVAGEVIAYASATRPEVLLVDRGGGVFSNASQPSPIKSTSAVTIRGAFIVSSPTKGGTTGVLISAVRFDAPAVLAAGQELIVTATQALS